MVDLLMCHLQLKIKSKTACTFLMCRLFMKIKYLPLNDYLPLAGFIHILTIFCHLPVTSVPFTHSRTDASKFALAEINYALN